MIGKLGQEVVVEDCVSHVSHRGGEKGCGVAVNYVNKVSRCWQRKRF
jgi:hypothetical protein